MWGRIKAFLTACALALAPALYIFGRLHGRKTANADRAEDAAKANADVADFHKRMVEDDPETIARNDRAALVERLRTKGL